MCSNAACKAQKGMCGHEKMMVGVVALLGVGALVHFVFHLV